MRIPLLDLQAIHAPLRAELDAAIATVLDSGAFVLGHEVSAFEAEFAAFCGVAHGVGVANGTDALMLALEACGIGPGDEVLVPAFTFIATAGVVSRLGARLVFADVDAAHAGLTAATVAPLLGPATKAVIAVHLYGHPAALIELRRLLEPRGVVLLEDAAQAHGARLHGARVGGFGRAGCFSFYPTKNLGALGDGGIVVTREAELAERLRLLRNHGRRTQDEHLTPGVNSRLDAIQAAVLRVKLRSLAAWNEARRRLAALYDALLAPLPQVTRPGVAEGAEPVYHQYVVRVEERERLRAFLAERGIATAVYYPLALHEQPAYRGPRWPLGAFPVAEGLARRVLSLPLYPGLPEDAVCEVCAAIADFYSGKGA